MEEEDKEVKGKGKGLEVRKDSRDVMQGRENNNVRKKRYKKENNEKKGDR